MLYKLPSNYAQLYLNMFFLVRLTERHYLYMVYYSFSPDRLYFDGYDTLETVHYTALVLNLIIYIQYSLIIK